MLKAQCIVSDSDKKLLAYNGFDGFESLWDLELEWFEEPNYRRRGWSGVSRYVLKRPEGDSLAVFIKRQQNHNFRSLLHLIRGLPTTYREYENLRRMREYGIPCPDVIFYGHRTVGGQWQAVLITRSLTEYQPLEHCLNAIAQDDVAARKALLASVAHTLGRMHNHHLRHGSLYAKHILVRARRSAGSKHDGACEFDSVVIDLERMRTCFPLSRLALRDLGQLQRRWNRREGDWEAFIDSYLAHVKLGPLGGKIRDATIARSPTDGAELGRSNSAGRSARRLASRALHSISGEVLGDNVRRAAVHAESPPACRSEKKAPLADVRE